MASSRIADFDVDSRLNVFFGEVGLKMKLEPKTRQELRQVFKRNITGLVDVINKITTAILAQAKRPPLVLIDDLDKPDLEVAKGIFYEWRGHYAAAYLPHCLHGVQFLVLQP